MNNALPLALLLLGAQEALAQAHLDTSILHRASISRFHIRNSALSPGRFEKLSAKVKRAAEAVADKATASAGAASPSGVAESESFFSNGVHIGLVVGIVVLAALLLSILVYGFVWYYGPPRVPGKAGRKNYPDGFNAAPKENVHVSFGKGDDYSIDEKEDKFTNRYIPHSEREPRIRESVLSFPSMFFGAGAASPTPSAASHPADSDIGSYAQPRKSSFPHFNFFTHQPPAHASARKFQQYSAADINQRRPSLAKIDVLPSPPLGHVRDQSPPPFHHLESPPPPPAHDASYFRLSRELKSGFSVATSDNDSEPQSPGSEASAAFHQRLGQALTNVATHGQDSSDDEDQGSNLPAGSLPTSPMVEEEEFLGIGMALTQDQDQEQPKEEVADGSEAVEEADVEQEEEDVLEEQPEQEEEATAEEGEQAEEEDEEQEEESVAAEEVPPRSDSPSESSRSATPTPAKSNLTRSASGSKGTYVSSLPLAPKSKGPK